MKGEFKTVREAKDYFRQIRKEQDEITHLMALIEKEEAMLLPQGIRYDRDKVQTSAKDSFTERAAELGAYWKELDESLAALRNRKREAERTIRKLNDADEREVMRHYYLTSDEGHSLSWDDVAQVMNYNKRWVLKIHGKALQKITQNNKEDT